METDSALDLSNLSAAETTSTMICYGVGILIVLIFLVILILRLSKSMSAASENNARINQYLAAVPVSKVGTIMAVYQNTQKNLGLALLLALLFGTFGAHKVYLGEKKSAILFLVFCWTGIPTIIRWFNAANMPQTVSAYNLSVIESLYNQIAAPQVES